MNTDTARDETDHHALAAANLADKVPFHISQWLRPWVVVGVILGGVAIAGIIAVFAN